MSKSPAPAPSDDKDAAPRAADALAGMAVRIAGKTKVDPVLFRAVEVVLESDGRLAHKGKIWHHDLKRARQFGRALAANSSAQRVQIADAAGTILETIPPPPPGSPAIGWGAWQSLPLPPLPPRPPPAKKKAPAKAVAPPAPAAPAESSLAPARALPTLEEPESEVERTRTLPPA